MALRYGWSPAKSPGAEESNDAENRPTWPPGRQRSGAFVPERRLPEGGNESQGARPRRAGPAGDRAVQPSRRLELQWLRAFAANEVVLCHSDLLTKHFSGLAIARSWYQPFSALGVELFFIVSGYVIAMRVGAKDTGGAFFAARVLRLLPMYWFFTSIVVAVYLVKPAWHLMGFSPDPISMAKTYLILPQQGFPILGVGWTLEHEVLFYLGVALMLATVGSGRGARLGLAWLLTGLGAIGLALGSPAGPIAGGGTLGAAFLTHVFNPFMLAFALGWLVRELEGRKPAELALQLLPLTLLLLWAAWEAPAGKLMPLWRIAAAGLVFAGFLLCRHALEKENRLGRTMVLLGEASFSIYLSHWFVLSAGGKLLGHFGMPASYDLPVRLVGVALALAVGVAFYVALEKPVDRWLRPGGRLRSFGLLPPAVTPAPAPIRKKPG